MKGRYPTDQGFDEWYGIANTTDESGVHPRRRILIRRWSNRRRFARRAGENNRWT